MKYKGKATLNPGTPDDLWGLCDDLEIKQAADKEQVKNGSNDTVGVLWSDTRKEVSGTYTPLAGVADSPAAEEDLIGEELTVKLHGENKTIKILIDDASIKYTRGKVSTFSFSGTYYPNLVVTPAT